MYVSDLVGNEYLLQASTTHESELSGNRTLSLSVIPSKANSLFIKDIAEMWVVTDDDGITHKVVYAKRKGQGDSLTVDIKAIPLFFDDFDNQRIYTEYNQHMTAHAAFTLIFADSGYNFVLHGTHDAIDWQGFGGGETRLETFKRAIDRYGAEFEISGNTIHLKPLIGRDTQFQYRYKLNASNIVQEIDASGFWTYAKGYGDYGSDGEEGGADWQDAKLIREYTSPLAAILGEREAPPIKDGRVKIVSVMDNSLKTLVNESLKVSVSTDIHDLRKQGYALAQPELGDRVFLTDERIGFDEEVRVVAMSLTKDWRGNVTHFSITIGDEGVTKRYTSNLKTAVDNISGIVNGTQKIPYNVLDNAVLEATKALQSAQTELNFENGIVAIDKLDPNYVTILNSAGVGVSIDGGATFGQAITGRGINASYIVTGVLDAGKVIVRGGSATNYTLIDGSYLESRGKFTRTWQGETTTHDVSTRHENGYIRLRNNDTAGGAGSSIYLADFGFSAQVDGDNASGSLLWWDKQYSSVGTQGITLSSYAGAVGVKSALNRVVIDANQSVNLESWTSPVFIRPRVSDRSYDQTFNFTTAAVGSEGYLMYGDYDDDRYNGGLRFNHSGKASLQVVDSNFSTGGDTFIEAGYGEFNTVRRRPGNDYLAIQHADIMVVGSDNAARVASGGIYDRTYAGAANVHITAEGTLGRSTSASKYKLSIEKQYKNTQEQISHSKGILNLDISTWFDKSESEIYAEECEKRRRLSADGFEIKRHVGLIAEDVRNVGLSEYVMHGGTGEIEGIAYDRLWIHLIPVVRDLTARIKALEGAT